MDTRRVSEPKKEVRGGSRSERREASKFCDMRCGERLFDSETGKGNTYVGKRRLEDRKLRTL
jgi:hypothetical protein